MTGSELNSSLLMPSTKFIEKEQRKLTSEVMGNRVSRIKRCLGRPLSQKERKTECERPSRSRDQGPQRMSPGLMPSSQDHEYPIEPSSKTAEHIERDTGTQQGTANPGFLGLDHCHTCPKDLCDTGGRTANSSTNEEVVAFDDLADSSIDSLTHLASNIHEECSLLHCHAKDLRVLLSALSTDGQIAKEKSDSLSERVKIMSHEIRSNITAVERQRDMLSSEFQELVEENHVLREQLSDTRSHIFSLQPYRKDCTPEEIGQEYDALVEQVQDWVQKLMSQWMDGGDDVDAFLNHAKKCKADVSSFKSVLDQYPDLIHGFNFPETDEDIITSVIMRYLHDKIFQSVLYGFAPRSVQTITSIENLMHVSVKPKRDLFTVRTWVAEAYDALLSSTQLRSFRQKRAVGMSEELTDILNIFIGEEQYPNLFQDLFDLVIYPAMRLYEKLQVSTNHYYLDIDHFIVKVYEELNTTPSFVASLTNLDCKNILQNRKGFNVEKLDPPPSKQELCCRLHNVCSVVPALYVRQIGQKDTIKDPIVVRKQQILVAWGSGEKQRVYQDNGDRSLISQLYALNSSEGYGPSSDEGTKPCD
ncbi:hypothetical protein FBEOM_6070 [Fusarium beomiforme]|uniref:Uncharacterized protein n=1 Tax=Fusarium beomiforme TaxID=44412 RepID=A0A9P5DWN1_9HYPO|nr:hypothetical protein FBEOM_6070 [Fusarium beomiforme]